MGSVIENFLKLKPPLKVPRSTTAMSYHIMELYVVTCRMSKLSWHPYCIIIHVRCTQTTEHNGLFHRKIERIIDLVVKSKGWMTQYMTHKLSPDPLNETTCLQNTLRSVISGDNTTQPCTLHWHSTRLLTGPTGLHPAIQSV